jgi:DNA-binding MarR family transcriptional regulator
MRACRELELRALRFIVDAIKQTGRPPTQLQIGNHCGLSQSGVCAVLERLAGFGLIIRAPRELKLRRSIEVTIYGLLELGEGPLFQREANLDKAVLRVIYESICAIGKPPTHKDIGERLGTSGRAVYRAVLRLERAYLIERPWHRYARASNHRGERMLKAGADALGLPMPAFQASWDTKRKGRRTLAGKVIFGVRVLRQLPLSPNYVCALPCGHDTCLTRRRLQSLTRPPVCRTCQRAQ